MLWVSPGRQLIPTHCSLTLSQLNEGRAERIKVRKIVFWDKGSLIIDVVVRRSRVKQWIHLLFPWISRYSAIPGRSGSIICVDDLGRQMLSLQMSPLPPSPSFYCQAQHLMVWISSWALGVSSPHYVSSQPLVHAQPCHEKRCYGSEWPKHPCMFNSVFIRNLKHSAIGAAMDKINSILPLTNPKSVYSPYTVLRIDWFAYPHLAVLEFTGGQYILNIKVTEKVKQKNSIANVEQKPWMYLDIIFTSYLLSSRLTHCFLSFTNTSCHYSEKGCQRNWPRAPAPWIALRRAALSVLIRGKNLGRPLACWFGCMEVGDFIPPFSATKINHLN